MRETQPTFLKDPQWTDPGSSRVPFWAYTRNDLYQRELERFFYTNHWCYVGL